MAHLLSLSGLSVLFAAVHLTCASPSESLLAFHVGPQLGLPQPSARFFQAFRDSPVYRFVAQAETHTRTGRLPDAARAYEHALASYALDVEEEAPLQLALGGVYAQLSLAASAERAYLAAAESRRLAHLAHWALGSVFAREGRFRDAARELEVASALRPGWFPALHNLGSVLIIRGDIDGGLASFESAVASLTAAGHDLPVLAEAEDARARALLPTDAPGSAGTPRLLLQQSQLEKHLIEHILRVFKVALSRGGAPDARAPGSGGGDEGDVLATGLSLWAFLQRLASLDLASLHRGLGFKLLETGAFAEGLEHLSRAVSLSPERNGHLGVLAGLALPVAYASAGDVWDARARVVRAVRDALQERTPAVHPERLKELYMATYLLPYSGLPAHHFMRDVARYFASCEDPVLETDSPHLRKAYPHALAHATGNARWAHAAPAPVGAAPLPAALAAGLGLGLGVGVGVGGAAAGAAAPAAAGSGPSTRASRAPAAAAASAPDAASADNATSARPPQYWHWPVSSAPSPAAPKKGGAASPSAPERPPAVIRVGFASYQMFDAPVGHLLLRIVKHLKGYAPALAAAAQRAAGKRPGGGSAQPYCGGREGPSEGAGALPRYLHACGNASAVTDDSWRAPRVWGEDAGGSDVATPGDPLERHGYTTLPGVAGFHITLLRMTAFGDAVSRWIFQAVDNIVNVYSLARGTGAGAAEAGGEGRHSFNLEAVRSAIAKEQLDVLIVFETGIQPESYTLLFARSAPVQVVLWGSDTAKALTLGLPDSVDYFVIGDGAADSDAQSHLLEQSVRLGDLGVYSTRIAPPRDEDIFAAVATHGLLEGAHLYLVPAPLAALHPAFDDVIVGVLLDDPRGEVMLLYEAGQDLWLAVTRARLLAHARMTPAAYERLRFTEEPGHVVGSSSQRERRALMAAAEVVLDTFPVGIGVAALDALEAGTPVVTLPSLQPQQRLAAAALTRLGLAGDLAAAGTPQELVASAVRVACNATFRRGLRRRIAARASLLEWPEAFSEGRTHAAAAPSASDKLADKGAAAQGDAAAAAAAAGGEAEQLLDEEWLAAQRAAGFGAPSAGTLNDWAAFLGRVGRPWAEDRAATAAEVAAHSKAGTIAGGKGGKGGRGSAGGAAASEGSGRARTREKVREKARAAKAAEKAAKQGGGG